MTVLSLLSNARIMDTTAMRDAYCGALIEAALRDERVVAVETDVMASMGTTAFARRFPGRSFNCGIQEANAACIAAALSLEGFVPFLHAFAPFASRRAYDQVFLSVGYQGASVRIIGGDAGVTAAYNGGTHMPFEDIALMRAVPGMIVLDPADTVCVRALVPMIAAVPGSVYMRCSRKKMRKIYAPEARFEIGRANLLREGADVTILAAGVEVAQALDAADILAARGIEARVADLFSVRPLDREFVLESAETTRAAVVCENHSICGGLGEAVCRLLALERPTPVETVGVRDAYGETGSPEELMGRFHLAAEDIAQAALRAVRRKNHA